MGNSKKDKKKERQPKSNIEKKNLQKIQEIKDEDNLKRIRKRAKKAEDRKKKASLDKEKNLQVKSDKNFPKNPKDKNVKNKKEKNDNAKKAKRGKGTKESNTKKKSKNSNKKEAKEISTKKLAVLKVMALVIIIACLVFIAILAYLALRPKFHDITIELGTSEISINEFLVSDIYKNGVQEITDLSLLDLSQVQTLDIVLSFKGKEETVKLNIVDTTAPTVEVQDIHKYLDYSINPEDFIVSKEDYSEMTVEIVNNLKFEDYGTYPVTIKVTDAYGNETIKECNLIITWLLFDVKVELGSEFSASNIVVEERFSSLVPETEVAKVDTMQLGTYELYVDIDGKTYTSTVVVQDTTPPDLQVQDITIWNDETISGFESFIVSVTDISGEVTTTSDTTIDYTIIGTQNIVIKATDVNGNSAEKIAVLTIKTDTTGPAIYGLSNLTVNKYSSINYESGVYATDDKDGSVSFTVDSSGVNTSSAGTYYATYTSKDSAGNTTTSKRKITVNWDSDDVNAKINSFYSSYCAGLSAEGITSVVNSKIKYRAVSYSDRNSNIYYGLTNGAGNCIVHAYILQAMLNKAGYSCSIIRTSDGAHYWNISNGVHYDATGGSHLLVASSSEEKASEPYMVSHGYTVDNFVY